MIHCPLSKRFNSYHNTNLCIYKPEYKVSPNALQFIIYVLGFSIPAFHSLAQGDLKWRLQLRFSVISSNLLLIPWESSKRWFYDSRFLHFHESSA